MQLFISFSIEAPVKKDYGDLSRSDISRRELYFTTWSSTSATREPKLWLNQI